jgi:hypothetical protein
LYQHAALPFAAAASLPFTGFGVVWLLLAAVAMLALAGALRRLSPKREA